MTAVVPESAWLGRSSPLVAVCTHLCDFLQWRFSLLPTGAFRYARRTDGGVDETSEIHISTDFPMNPDVIGQRPAISVFRSGAQLQGIGIGDRGFLDFASGAEMRADLVPLNIMVGVLSGTPWEAEALAWHALNEISAFRNVIVKTSPDLVYLGNRPSLTPPGPPGAMVDSPADNWRAVIIGFPAFLSYKHIVTPLNRPFLSGVDGTLTVTPPTAAPAPVIPLQGSAIMQPAPVIPLPGPPGLPQTPPIEANSTEPLSIEIKVR